jgi:hypothetical protein
MRSHRAVKETGGRSREGCVVRDLSEVVFVELHVVRVREPSRFRLGEARDEQVLAAHTVNHAML